MSALIFIIVLIIFIVFNFLIGNKEFFDNIEKNDDIQCFTNRLTLVEKECYIDLLKKY